MSSEQLIKKMHCVNLVTKEIFVGIDAVAAIAFRLPILFVLYFPIRISSFIGIGDYRITVTLCSLVAQYFYDHFYEV